MPLRLKIVTEHSILTVQVAAPIAGKSSCRSAARGAGERQQGDRYSVGLDEC